MSGNVVAVVVSLVIVGLGGWLFWKLVRIMARIQMPRAGGPGQGSRFASLAGAMASSSYDCVVIGSGPGGYVAAIRAAQLGLRAAVVESDEIGGRCLNYACIPAKAVLRVADVLQEVARADDFGIEVAEPAIDFDAVGQRRERVIKTLTGGVSGLFKKNGIDYIEGHGSVTADANVKVGGNFDGDELEATKGVILATGSVARPIPGTSFGGRVIGTEEAWALDRAAVLDGRRRRGRVGHRDRQRVRAHGRRR